MQVWKPAVTGEAFLTKTADGKIELYRVNQKLTSASRKPKPMVMAVFKNIAPGTANPDRFDIMSEENWETFLVSLDGLKEAFSGLTEAKARAKAEREAKARATVETVKATGLPRVALIAAIRAQLEADGYTGSEVTSALANVA